MAKSPANNAAQRVRKKVRKNVSDGIAHVHASFNNTIITITDRQGNALGRVGMAEGLIGDTVYGMTQDRDAGLWLALDNGLARVEVGSPLTRFTRMSGLDGSVMAIHRHGRTLYAGTAKGLFRLDETKARFTRVAGIHGQVWDMLDMDGSLLVASAQGLFEVDGNRAARQLSREFSFTLARVAPHDDRLLAGQRDGLLSMRFASGRLVREGKVALEHEGAGDAEALLLTAGELLGTSAQMRFFKADRAHQLAHLALERIGIKPGQHAPERQGRHRTRHDVQRTTAARDEAEMLVDHGNALAQSGQRAAIDALAIDQHLPHARRRQPVDAAQERGLARARGAKQDAELPGGNGEIDTIEGTGAVGPGLHDLIEADLHGLSAPPIS